MKFPSSPNPNSRVPVVTELAPRTIIDGSNHDCLSSPNHVTTPALFVKAKQKVRTEENHFASKTEAEEILKNFSPNENLKEKKLYHSRIQYQSPSTSFQFKLWLHKSSEVEAHI